MTTLCPDTVRACIAALPAEDASDLSARAYDLAIRDSRRSLEALLPKPDPAKALVERFQASRSSQAYLIEDGVRVSSEEGFARWLIDQNLIRSEMLPAQHLRHPFERSAGERSK